MKKNRNTDVRLSSVFGYENLKMYQSTKYFSMTSDALCLSQFVQLHYRDKKVLDIGTGLGGIPLILSTKGNIHITGVEIESQVAKLASQSVCYNHLQDKISIVNQDIKDFAKSASANTFDIVVSNPPYYVSNCGYLNKNSTLTHARHNTKLEVDDIFKIATKLLKNHGKLVLVFTTERFVEILNLYQKYHFAIKRIQFIHGGDNKIAKTFLIEGSKNGRNGMKVEFPIIFHS